MNFSKILARKIVFPVLTAFNIERLFSLFSKFNRLIVVYHGVLPDPDLSMSNGHLPTKEFEKQLMYFQNKFEVIPLKEMFHSFRRGAIPKKKTIAITFDDGYENNYSQAFPLLEKYQLPATFFIASKCYEDENFILWYDLLDFIKKKIPYQEMDFSDISVRSHLSAYIKNRFSTGGEIKSLFKKLNSDEKRIVFTKIKNQFPEIMDYKKYIDSGYWKMISKEQLKHMAVSNLVEIGSHTMNHPNLSAINLEDVEYEVTASKKILENITGKEVESIAFPDGDYNDAVKKLCLLKGYKNLLAVDYRCNSDKNDNSILPRFGISNTTTTDSNMILLHTHFNKSGF